MAKPISELRANTDQTPSRVRRSYSLCVAPHLLAEMQTLSNELLVLEPDHDDAGTPRKPTRNASPEIARAREIRARMAELKIEIDDKTGELVLEALEDGQWEQWVVAHPARQDETQPGEILRDSEITAGYCNSDDLMNELGQFAYTWDGAPFAEGEWDWIRSNTGRGDRKAIARLVVVMHEQGVDIPFLQRALRGALMNEPA